MPTNTETETVAVPVSAAKLSNLYRLFYKCGMNPRAELIFPFDGDKSAAIQRGREFCLRMNYKFIHVETLLVNLDETEKRLLGKTE